MQIQQQTPNSKKDNLENLENLSITTNDYEDYDDNTSTDLESSFPDIDLVEIVETSTDNFKPIMEPNKSPIHKNEPVITKLENRISPLAKKIVSPKLTPKKIISANNDPFLHDLKARIQLKQQQKRVIPTVNAPIQTEKTIDMGNRSPSKRRISFSNKFQEEHFSKLTSGQLSANNRFSARNPLDSNRNSINEHVNSESFTRAFNKLNQNTSHTAQTKPATIVELNSRKYPGPTSPISFNKTSPMAINKNSSNLPTSRLNSNRLNNRNVTTNNLAASVASSIQPDFFTPPTTATLFNKNNKKEDDILDFEEVYIPPVQIEEPKTSIKLRSLIPFNSNLPKNDINKIESSTTTTTISSVTFMNAASLLNKPQLEEPSKLGLYIFYLLNIISLCQSFN